MKFDVIAIVAQTGHFWDFYVWGTPVIRIFYCCGSTSWICHSSLDLPIKLSRFWCFVKETIKFWVSMVKWCMWLMLYFIELGAVFMLFHSPFSYLLFFPLLLFLFFFTSSSSSYIFLFSLSLFLSRSLLFSCDLSHSLFFRFSSLNYLEL